jgi:hypothetical protein
MAAVCMACIVITDIPVAIVVATWIKWTCSTWDGYATFFL